MKTLLLVIFLSILNGDNLRSEFYYDSVLSCDEVREKIVLIESEMAKIERFSKGKESFILPIDLFFNVPKAIFDDVKYDELERRLENLQTLEKEKCNIRKELNEYFSK